MAASLYKRQGSRTIMPATGQIDGVFGLEAPLESEVYLKNQQKVQYTLMTDAPVVVPFGGVTYATSIIIRVVGGGCSFTIVNPSGTSTHWCEPDIELRCDDATKAYTALTIQRPTGIPVDVYVFLGEKA